MGLRPPPRYLQLVKQLQLLDLVLEWLGVQVCSLLTAVWVPQLVMLPSVPRLIVVQFIDFMADSTD